MRLSIRLLLPLLLTTAATPPAMAAGDAEVTVARLRETALQYVGARIAPTARAEAAALDPRLRLPACATPLAASGTAPTAGSAWSVAVSCESAAGTPPRWSIYVPVRVTDLRPVVVLTRAVSAGQPIPADALSLQSRDIAGLGYGWITDPAQASGQTLRRPLATGSVLTPDTLAAPVRIKRGALVTLVGMAGGLEIRAQGKALTDAGIGDRINVENTGSHRVVDGVVRDSGTVEVGL